LRYVEFGRPEGTKEGLYRKFDHDYWEYKEEVKTDRNDEAILQLLKNKLYADAIIAIVENPDLWKFDCWQFVQVCNLYALIDPDVKSEFYDKIKANLVPHEDSEFCIRTFDSWVQRPFESTGLKVKQGYYRHEPNAPWRATPTGETTSLDLDSLLKNIPIGSRVSWSIFGLEKKNPFHTENTIKMGTDSYAAHPFVRAEAGSGYVSRGRLERLLLDVVKEKNPSIKKENVFLSDIALFDTP
jgi:hypothetical protein